MKRWNEYFERMDPKNKKPHIPDKPIDVRRSASVKYFSVYPRKLPDSISGHVTPVASQVRRGNHNKDHDSHIPRPSHQHHHQQQQQPAVEDFHEERYISRSNEFGSVSNRVDGGHTNYAWVD